MHRTLVLITAGLLSLFACAPPGAPLPVEAEIHPLSPDTFEIHPADGPTFRLHLAHEGPIQTVTLDGAPQPAQVTLRPTGATVVVGDGAPDAHTDPLVRALLDGR